MPENEISWEEVDELNNESLLNEDEEILEKNAELARENGWEYLPGVGYVDQAGSLMLDDVGRSV